MFFLEIVSMFSAGAWQLVGWMVCCDILCSRSLFVIPELAHKHVASSDLFADPK